MLFGTIEAGGTKFVVAVVDHERNILVRKTIPTESPDVTLPKVLEIFKDYELTSLGIGSFGPIDLNQSSATYGYITSTPKPFWNNVDIVGYFKTHLNIPIGFDTDVNAAAYAELFYGAAMGLNNCVYLTVGTGIGGGVVVNSDMVHGLSHPEVGHILVNRHPNDTYVGTCPFHKDCLEGLAAGPSIKARYGIEGQNLPIDHEAWEFESYYLAQAIMNLVLILSPEKIILGGGVMHQEHLLKKIREQLMVLLNDYVDVSKMDENFIVNPQLGDNAGLFGAFKLAQSAID